MKKYMVVTQNVGKTFAVGISEALKEMGHDVLRSTRGSAKRISIKIDQPEKAYNKLQQLQLFKNYGIPTVEFTTAVANAVAWLMEDYTVVCRKTITGYGGDGIVMANSEDELVEAPLYTRYTKKKSEFRVHVFNGEVIFVQEKRKRKDVPAENVNYQVRNHENGWVFCHQDVKLPQQDKIFADAIKAVKRLGYKYGAIDIIYNEAKDQYYFLEVNSRPGIEGETAKAYAAAFLKELDARAAPATPEIDLKNVPLEVYIEHLKTLLATQGAK